MNASANTSAGTTQLFVDLRFGRHGEGIKTLKQKKQEVTLFVLLSTVRLIVT